MTMSMTQKKLWWLTIGLVFMFIVFVVQINLEGMIEDEIRDRISKIEDNQKLQKEFNTSTYHLKDQIMPSCLKGRKTQ